MDRELHHRLHTSRGGLSPQFDRVASYLIRNADHACFMNARALAGAAGVSAPTVVRFVKRLGYKDFRAFRRHLQDSAQKELRSHRNLSAVVKPQKNRSLMEQVIEEEASAIRESLKLIREEDFQLALTRICRANSVYLLAAKTSFATAYMLYFRLSKLGVDCKLISPGGLTVFGELAPMSSKDLLLVIGFQRITSDVHLALRDAKRKKVPMIGITDSAKSPIAALADVVLYVDRGPREELRSVTPCIALGTALVVGVAARNGKRAARISAEVDALENSSEMYLRGDNNLRDSIRRKRA